MSKHTPGPWIGAGPSFGDPLPRYTTEIVTDWEDEDGEVLPICELPFAHLDDENEANARLIAASPDMYEALVMVRDADEDCKRDGLPTIPPAARAEIDAAIAKAEGQQ